MADTSRERKRQSNDRDITASGQDEASTSTAKRSKPERTQSPLDSGAESMEAGDMGSRHASSQQQPRKREGMSLHSGSRSQERPPTLSSTVHRPKGDRVVPQQREHHGKRGDEAHHSSRRDRSERSGKSRSSSGSRHRHSRQRDDRRVVHRSRSRPSNSRSDSGSRRERSREWGHVSGEAEQEEEDLRRILERRRQEAAKSLLSRSPSSSEEEGEMKDSKERDIPGSPASSSSNTSSSGSSNVPPTQPNRGDMSDISDVSEGASSPVAAKGSRWLSKDSGSEEDDTVGARSGKMPKGKAVESAAQPSAFSHRSIGGYGIHEEEMSSESDGEVEVPATKEEMLKELGVVGEEVVEEEEEEEPSSPGTPPLPDYFPGIHGCRNVENYEWLNRIEEGTYGVVFRGRDKRTDEVVALKKLKMEKEKEGFPITSLREVCCLLKASHPNIVHVREIVVGSSMDKIYIVMDFIEHDLKSLMETMQQPFLAGEVKKLLHMLLSGVQHLHDNWILHRDLKASNLLLSHKGVLKIGDFGLAREYGSPLKPYTQIVVTLWYRCPELLLGAKEYSTAVDMWSVGCIFGEFILRQPLFMGKSEIDQLNVIFKELGTPNEKIWPNYPEMPYVKKYSFKNQPYNNLRTRVPPTLLTNSGFDLLNRFLTYDPEKRISAGKALQHEYFTESPLPATMFPTWPAKSERTRHAKRERSPSAPKGGDEYSKLAEDEDSQSNFIMKNAKQGQAALGPGFTLKF